jgi:periplasmic protein TonB
MLPVLSALTIIVALSAAPVASGPQQAAAAAQKPRPTPDPLYDGTVRIGTAGLVDPVVIHTRHPDYTSDAMRNKVQGDVTVLVRVEPDGTVSYAEIERSVDEVYGLDREALAAAKDWRFKPATLTGKAVPVVCTITMNFHLH